MMQLETFHKCGEYILTLIQNLDHKQEIKNHDLTYMQKYTQINWGKLQRAPH